METMVGAVRFELTTSCTRNTRASQATLRPEPEDANLPCAARNCKLFWENHGADGLALAGVAFSAQGTPLKDKTRRSRLAGRISFNSFSGMDGFKPHRVVCWHECK